MASGVLLLFLRCIRVGEEITAAGFTGRIREIGLFRTLIITNDGLFTTIPNTTLFSGAIVNNSREPRRLVTIDLGIDCAQDIGKVLALAIDVARTNKRVLRNPEPTATVKALGDSDVTISLSAWTTSADYGSTASELRRGLREKFSAAGIRAPQPPVNVAAPPASSTRNTIVRAEPVSRRKSG